MMDIGRDEALMMLRLVFSKSQITPEVVELGELEGSSKMFQK